MGYLKKRTDKHGKTRYTAVYLDPRGKERSAGTFSNKKEADDAWQDRESEVRRGRLGDPSRGRQTFRKYVEKTWFPHLTVEPTTREKYSYYLDLHILPFFGSMRMIHILPEHVREDMDHVDARSERVSMVTRRDSRRS